MDKKIKIIVSGDQVTEIYGQGDLSDIAIEVIDLDRPAFETPEEKAHFDALEEEVEEMENSPEWTALLY